MLDINNIVIIQNIKKIELAIKNIRGKHKILELLFTKSEAASIIDNP